MTAGGVFQFAHETTEDRYTYWSKQPGVMENVNIFMQGLFGTPEIMGWTDWFPVKIVCLDGFDKQRSEYCWGDVGGGKGQESKLVLKLYLETKGKFVVEDQPFVIDDITDLDPRIERLPHDFMKPQLIRGLLIYIYMPFIFCSTLTHCL